MQLPKAICIYLLILLFAHSIWSMEKEEGAKGIYHTLFKNVVKTYGKDIPKIETWSKEKIENLLSDDNFSQLENSLVKNWESTLIKKLKLKIETSKDLLALLVAQMVAVRDMVNVALKIAKSAAGPASCKEIWGNDYALAAETALIEHFNDKALKRFNKIVAKGLDKVDKKSDVHAAWKASFNYIQKGSFESHGNLAEFYGKIFVFRVLKKLRLKNSKMIVHKSWKLSKIFILYFIKNEWYEAYFSRLYNISREVFINNSQFKLSVDEIKKCLPKKSSPSESPYVLLLKEAIERFSLQTKDQKLPS